MANAAETRIGVRDRYKTILNRNYYSQPRRTYVNTKYKDGKYYSDCSSSVAWAYKAEGLPIKYNGSSLPSTVGMYLSKDLQDVPVVIKNGQIQNPDVLRVGDLLLFAGTDTSRKYAGYVGHVEMVGEISGKTIYIYGHGSKRPRRTEMTAYLKSRYKSKTSTAVGNKGLIKVRRRIVDDADVVHLGDRELRRDCLGNDVRELQLALIALGYSCGPDGADADFGENTEKAVRAFQAAAGLPQTGVCDAATCKAIQAAQGGSGGAGAAGGGENTYTVTGDSVNLRSGPGTQYHVLKIVHKGDKLAALETSGWVPVVHLECACWVSEKYATRNGDAVKITGKTVNVRSGPGTQYRVVTVAKKGETYEAIDAGDWKCVSVGAAACWISGKFV